MCKKIIAGLWVVNLLLIVTLASAQSSPNSFKASTEPELIGKYLYLLEDKTGQLTFDDVKDAKNFALMDKEVPNLNTSSSVFWLRFEVENITAINDLILNVAQPVLDELSFYYKDSTGKFAVIEAGEQFPFSTRKYKEESYIFDLNGQVGNHTYYLRIHSGEQLLLPIYIGKKQLVLENQNNKRVLFGIYAGIILIMFFYNLFVLISTRDKSYFWYVIHTLFVGLTQASLQGYAFQYLWPGSSWLAHESIFIFTCLVSIAGIEFLKVFLHTKQTAPKLHKGLYVFTGLYFLFIIMSLLGIHSTTFGMILGTQSLVALYLLYLAFYIYRKGFAAAKFYLLAWGSLLVGIIVYVMKDFGVLPYNLLTNSSLLIGSALEVALLSIALANKINLLTKENEENQLKVIEAVKENERIVLEQNVMLEAKVNERTSELNNAMDTLKNAQSKLVDAEKMSSLGQLTAGIAHEINNPVNFITSNIKPLHRDVHDVMELIKMYEGVTEPEKLEDKLKEISNFRKEIDFDFVKEEIELLIKTIDDGAQRTSEIVKGLRNFSRVDEQDLKRGDIHLGIDSTLMLLRNKLDNINVIKNYGDIPEIECFMGKLNQVFMNIIGNAVYAIKANRNNNPKGVLTITTANAGDNITISIKDNGTGMDEKTKAKIFEPFFTTKEVGQGTGLGLSIVFNIIIESHGGKVEVNSTLGEGSEFILTLPKVQG
jgi:signal transduction histidine kinase